MIYSLLPFLLPRTHSHVAALLPLVIFFLCLFLILPVIFLSPYHPPFFLFPFPPFCSVSSHSFFYSFIFKFTISLLLLFPPSHFAFPFLSHYFSSLMSSPSTSVCYSLLLLPLFCLTHSHYFLSFFGYFFFNVPPVEHSVAT